MQVNSLYVHISIGKLNRFKCTEKVEIKISRTLEVNEKVDKQKITLIIYTYIVKIYIFLLTDVVNFPKLWFYNSVPLPIYFKEVIKRIKQLFHKSLIGKTVIVYQYFLSNHNKIPYLVITIAAFIICHFIDLF